MAFIQWSQQYSVGVKEFDEQHRHLIGILNELYDAMQQRKGKEVLSKVLNELIDYTVYHFDAENTVMEASNYPDTESHKQEHIKLTNDVLKFKRDFEAGNAMLSIELMHFLKDWLRVHILGTDKKYSVLFGKAPASQKQDPDKKKKTEKEKDDSGVIYF